MLGLHPSSQALVGAVLLDFSLHRLDAVAAVGAQLDSLDGEAVLLVLVGGAFRPWHEFWPSTCVHVKECVRAFVVVCLGVMCMPCLSAICCVGVCCWVVCWDLCQGHGWFREVCWYLA